MSTVRAVLDACDLIPSIPRDMLLRCAEAGLYGPYWSDDILAEVERNAIEHGMMAAEKARRLLNSMRAAFSEAMVSGPAYEHYKTIATNHPKDKHVLAAAIVAGAQVIVTENLKDFPEHALTPFRVEVLSADAFLSDLFDLEPDTVLRVTEERVAALRNPPETFDSMLDNMAKQLPKLATHLREFRRTKTANE